MFLKVTPSGDCRVCHFSLRKSTQNDHSVKNLRFARIFHGAWCPHYTQNHFESTLSSQYPQTSSPFGAKLLNVRGIPDIKLTFLVAQLTDSETYFKMNKCNQLKTWILKSTPNLFDTIILFENNITQVSSVVKSPINSISEVCGSNMM